MKNEGELIDLYLKKVSIQGYGSIKKLDFSPRFNENGSPIPIVIVGKNGSGKTLFLSQIVDSLVEMKRKAYNNIVEVSEQNYYKMGSKSYINHDLNESFVELVYSENQEQIKYVDFMIHDRDRLDHKFHDYENFESVLNDNNYQRFGFYKSIFSNNIENEFNDNIIAYFPVHRYHIPAWINKKNKKIGFQFTENNVGQDTNSIIKENVLNEIEHWLLDVLLDMYLYENQTNVVTIIDEYGNRRSGLEQVNSEGRNTMLIKLINQILTEIYKVKYDNLAYARIGVSNKSERSIAIFIKENDAMFEKKIAPSFSHLSSGEAMLLSLFASILKNYDHLNRIENLEDIKGLVIIDEIDLNLHIEFARNIIPNLISLFPNVQFILTSHSPFMLLGMEEKFKDRWQLINLPNGEEISIQNFSEVKTAYDIFIDGYEGIKNEYENLKNKIKNDNRTLIITEGKTDWKHLKNAYNKFRLTEEFNQLDIQFLEYDEKTLKMSDSQLDSLLKELAKIHHNYKVIGIFDSDESNGKKYSKNRINTLGNNVFALSIPTPYFRSDFEGISIEFLYKNQHLYTEDIMGRRLFVTTEFSNVSGRHINNKDLTYADNLSKLKNPKIIDDKVFNSSDENIALPKDQFAENILNSHPNFVQFDLEGFIEIFRIIDEIERI